MCGRAAYSARSVSAAANALAREEAGERTGEGGATKEGTDASAPAPALAVPCDAKGRPNAGPGHEFPVFRRSGGDRGSDGGTGRLECAPMIWGLVVLDGTDRAPHLPPTHPDHKSPHYKMFNARSETVCEKPSFRGLVREGRTCAVAVDGYYEWTASRSPGDRRKQPYFVRDEDARRPLLLAGVWTRVRTGRRVPNDVGGEEDETLTTFAILTTDAHPKLAWIHHRQPVVLRDTSVALEWLTTPTPRLVERISDAAKAGPSLLAHPVSKRIIDGKYQGDDCTTEVKLAKAAPSVKSFFSPASAKKAKTEVEAGEIDSHPSSSPAPAKILSLTRNPSPPVHTQSTKRQREERDPVGGEIISWTCSKCTFIHKGPSKYGYLACEVCGSERADGSPGIKRSQCSSSHDASTTKRRDFGSTGATDRNWAHH
ncbi:hypothetical protein ACHAWF_015867 [Thalassiosira exigua]